MTHADLDSWLLDARRRPLVVGVLNVTPDSFSDGGQFLDPAAAVARGREMLAAGADWIDVGGESTRPGSEAVTEAEQIQRIIPVIRLLREERAVISIDTTRAAVAEAALKAGACVINDITAATDDPLMPAVMRAARAIVLMHMQGRPQTMQEDPHYADVVTEVEACLLSRALALEEAGIDRRYILLDPGIGFGKTTAHNLQLLRALPRLAGHGYPIFVGVSRKRFIGAITGEPVASRRLMGTAAAVAWAVAAGASAVRVHDVPEMAQVVAMTRALAEG
jgi:dihydropteroate synthase